MFVRVKWCLWFGLVFLVILFLKEKVKDKCCGSFNGIEELEFGLVLNGWDNEIVKGGRWEDVYEEELRERIGYEGDDLLMIDGDLEKIVKKKKWKFGGVDEFLVLRMEDLGYKIFVRMMFEKMLMVNDVMKIVSYLIFNYF